MAEPVYTTITVVKATLQGSGNITVPDTMTDQMITDWIKERSREIDSSLPNYAKFPDISVTPAEGPPIVYGTPRMIQRICRLLVVTDGLRFLSLDKHGESGRDLTQEKAMWNLLTALATGAIEIPPEEYDHSQPSGREQREAADPDDSQPLYIAELTHADDEDDLSGS